MGTTDLEQHAAVYDSTNIFAVGTAHHAAETGSLDELAAAEAAGKARGYPALVTLETRDDILQCVPLHVAAEKGQHNVVQYLIACGVDLDAPDGNGVRPLHLAAITNRLDIVKLLIDKGANPTKQDSEGDVPLHWAATKGHTEMMEMLMDRGSAVDAGNKGGWTALHRAALTGRVPACRLLLRRGAGLNSITKDGRTALHLAALQNQLGVMELLLDMGAGTHFKDCYGQTAAEVCITDAARGLMQEKCAARAGGKASTATPASSRPASSTSPAKQVAAKPVSHSITHVPEMPRFKPAHNTNLDDDGFPAAVQHQQEELQGVPSASDLGGTELLLLSNPMLGQQLLPEQMPSLLSSGGSRHSLLSYQAPMQQQQQQQPGQLSASSSLRNRSAAGASEDAEGPADSQGRALPLLVPEQKPAGPNKTFLEKYGLQKAKGLFAP
ncbi:hypothetical protein OEZ86_006732 [Tetradesmus obliquus]|nr:hypothetical protein OEZ86_006732 [Tetradesmus obliquus]